MRGGIDAWRAFVLCATKTPDNASRASSTRRSCKWKKAPDICYNPAASDYIRGVKKNWKVEAATSIVVVSA